MITSGTFLQRKKLPKKLNITKQIINGSGSSDKYSDYQFKSAPKDVDIDNKNPDKVSDSLTQEHS